MNHVNVSKKLLIKLADFKFFFVYQAGLAGAFAQFTLGVPRTGAQSALEDHLRRQGWEVGNIDYMGRDSFDNIWTKICETMATAPSSQSTRPRGIAKK